MGGFVCVCVCVCGWVGGLYAYVLCGIEYYEPLSL